MLIDSHCHLDFPVLAKDREGVMARAHAAGVVRMVNIGTTRRDFPAIRATAESLDDVFCSFGIHPNHVHEEGEEVSTEGIIEYASHPKVVGIGETGLDYFYTKAPRDVQEASFRRHIRAAQATKLPLIIHSRDAEEDTIRVLKEEGPVTGLMHCFSSRRILA
jgi:TatD DNase family protein